MGPTRFWTWVALAVSAVAVGGSLFLSLGMDLVACPLCFYQRSFAMGVFGVLVMCLVSRAEARVAPATLAMPMALAGLFIAGFHVYLVLSGKLECPAGLLGLGSAPVQSAAVFALLVLTLALDTGAFTNRKLAQGQDMPPPARILGTALTPLLLGAFFAVGCILSAPKLPPAPTAPYPADKPLNTCRPPFQG